MQPRNYLKDLPRPSIVRAGLEVGCGLIGAFMLGSIGPAMTDWMVSTGSGGKLVRYPGPYLLTVLPIALLGLIVGWLIGARTARAIESVGLRWDRLEQGDKVTLFVGVFAGIVMSIPVLQFFSALDPTNTTLSQTKTVIIPATTIGFSALSLYALQSMSEILPWNRGRGPRQRSGIKILDTNVIIDGRIYEVAKAGFLEGQIYIPRFVLEELQHIADSSDSIRRQRGRRGLDILGHLQSEFEIEVGTHDRHAPSREEEVDSRIVRIAKALGADVVTNDWNLNRVAGLQDVRVISLNDLALAMRTNVLPQERIPVKVIREGSQAGQGVGYLEDGTMIVIEGGGDSIGETVDVTVSQVIQTERGKMIFGEVEGAEPAIRPEPRRRPAPRRTGL